VTEYPPGIMRTVAPIMNPVSQDMILVMFLVFCILLF
jgi:hypothetical protein